MILRLLEDIPLPKAKHKTMSRLLPNEEVPEIKIYIECDSLLFLYTKRGFAYYFFKINHVIIILRNYPSCIQHVLERNYPNTLLPMLFW